MDNNKNNNKTNGRCLYKNHPRYGNMYLNLSNKTNKYYIRTNMKGIINKYSIPDAINNKNLKLFQAICIIEDYNYKSSSYNIEFEQNIKDIQQNLTAIKTEIKNFKKGIILGKIGNENVFLNNSMYNDKYYLKLSSSSDIITIPIYYNIQKLTIEDAKNIIDFHKKYNNKLIGIREDKEIRIKNGKYSLYISYDNKMYSIPKYILDNLELLNIDSCNNIIDYHLKKTSKNNEIQEDIEPSHGCLDGGFTTNEPKKKSFLDIVKNK